MTQVIMTNSFRGGTGKTTILSNLAYNLASFGKRVVIIDSDIISPGIHAMFGLDRKSFDKTYTDFLLAGADVKECVYDISENVKLPEKTLYMVPSSIASTQIVEILQERRNYEKLGKGLEKLKKIYEPDFVMVDTHPGINEEFLIATRYTDILLNIIRPDNQDYQGAQVAADISKKVKLKMFFVLNKVHKKLRNNKLQKTVESAFKMPVAGMIPLSEEIMLAQSQFVFLERYPEHPFSQEIQLITDKVFDVRPKEHLEVMHEILAFIESKKTWDTEKFVCNKNIKPDRCMNYLDDLLKQKFISKHADKKGKTQYAVTAKGRRFLNKYKSISKFVHDFRL